MTRDECFELCKKIAPKYGYEPLLCLAICEQESGFDESESRLEQSFYRRYVRPKEYATSVEVLFSASYGLMQCLGWTLHEMEYFDPVTNKDVAHQIDQFMVDPEAQVEYGLRWLRQKQGKGSLTDGLTRYNGSIAYPPMVLAKYHKLKQSYGG